MSGSDQRDPQSDDLRIVGVLEDIAPWIVLAIAVAIALLLAIWALLGASPPA